MRGTNLTALAMIVLTAGLVAPASAQTPLTTVRVASGITGSPLFVTYAPGDPTRLFIVSQGSGGTGMIWVMKGGSAPALFMNVTGLVTGGEQGLLGLAFHPDYQTNGFFYVNYTASGGGATNIARFKALTPDSGDPASQFVMLTIAQPFSNHNGGWIAFGPDKYLYIGMGDGGSGGDPGNRAQNPLELLGKMLRIDVNGDDFPLDPAKNYAIPPTNPFFGSTSTRPEIWALGLRNPWRNAFDRATGDLYTADVGQAAVEEVNFQPGSSKGGENYGWRCYEGASPFSLGGCLPPASYVFPFTTYTHPLGCSITGGYVYRGCAIPDLHGTYFFADYCSNKVWSTQYAGSPGPAITDRTAELAPGGGLSIGTISSFGEDYYGELYIVDQGGGEVFKIVPRAPAPPPDCRQVCDANCDGNLLPTGKPLLDIRDFSCFQNKFSLGDRSADCTRDGTLDIRDFTCFQNAFSLGCP